ncbi:10053_t:CDS:2, partial [Entrophospora sp. SA101]
MSARKSTDAKPIPKTNILKFFPLVQRTETKKEKKALIYNDPKLESFYNFFRPFNVIKTMTMAPINKFQHPLDANFEKLVLNEYNNINNIKLPEQQQQSKLESKEYYIKEYLSAVRPKLLKKRGINLPINIKKLFSLKNTINSNYKEMVIKDHDIDANGDDNKKMMDIKSDDQYSVVEELSMEDKLNLLNDKSKVWIKLLQFGENHRPSYYGTWTKTSKKITGRRPFAKDPDYFDYDYDSEAEWELDDGEELKNFLVPDSYLSEDEGVEESDESINLSAESSPNKKNVVRKERGHRMIEPMKEMVIGPIFEEVLGDKNHQLSEYSIQFLNYNNVKISLPFDPFSRPKNLTEQFRKKKRKSANMDPDKATTIKALSSLSFETIESLTKVYMGNTKKELLNYHQHQVINYDDEIVQIVNESLAESYEDVTLEEDEEQILSSLQSSETIINTNNDEVLDISLEFNSQPIVLIENDIEDFDMNSLVNE